MIHPIVRIDISEINKLLQIFKEDNYEIIERTKISGKPIFIGRLKIIGKESILKKASDIKQMMNAEYVTQQINLMESSIENSPHISIGLAKELIETCCKSILGLSVICKTYFRMRHQRWCKRPACIHRYGFFQKLQITTVLPDKRPWLVEEDIKNVYQLN